MKTIEHYSFGSVKVDGRKYESDVIIYPDSIKSDWWRAQGHKLQLEDIDEILENPPEILVVGQGDSSRMQIDKRVTEELQKRNIELVAGPTDRACDKFNELSKKGSRVVAALHLTC